MFTSDQRSRPRGAIASVVFLLSCAAIALAIDTAIGSASAAHLVARLEPLAATFVLSATLGTLLTVLTHRRWRSRTVDDLLHRSADRFHDALAWIIARRAAVAVVAGSLGTVVAIQAFASGFALGAADDRESDARITFNVRGPDSTTLAGVGNRIAAEMRAVRGVAGVVVTGESSIENGAFIQDKRLDGRRIVRVQAFAMDRSLDEVRGDISAKVATTPLPPGYEAAERRSTPATTSRHAGGTVIGAALVVTLMVLALQFRSLVEPLVIAWSVLLTVGGTAVVLTMLEHRANFGSAVGAALAIAVTLWSATRLLDVARQRRALRTPARVALIEAARRQFRRQLVATVVLVAAMLPILFSRATASFASLGMVALVGIVVAGLVTLIVTPPLAASVDELAERQREWTATRRVQRRP